MRIRRGFIALIGVLLAAAAPAAAQQPLPASDSTRAQIRTTLRAFYFNLAHEDWEALAADILSAKVLASRPAPDALLTGAAQPTGTAEPACAPASAALVNSAMITLDRDWAGVSVPRCGATPGVADQFRLARFEGRWRIVHINLFRGSDAVQLAR